MYKFTAPRYKHHSTRVDQSESGQEIDSTEVVSDQGEFNKGTIHRCLGKEAKTTKDATVVRANESLGDLIPPGLKGQGKGEFTVAQRGSVVYVW